MYFIKLIWFCQTTSGQHKQFFPRQRVHLPFVGGNWHKNCLSYREKYYNPKMKGKKMNEQIIEQLEQTFKNDFELVSHNFADLERVVKEKMQLLGQGLLQRMVNLKPNGYQGSSIVCKCGHSMKFVQHRSRDIQTTFGWIRIKRAYYYCSDCGESLFPYDKASGLGSFNLSSALADACCLVATDDSFEQVSKKIEYLLGQKVCNDTISDVAHFVGAAALREQQKLWDSFVKDKQISQSEYKPKRLYICPDGTTVHEKDGWHETKVGSIYWEDERFVRHQRYVGRFDNSDVFGNYLWLRACRCGLREAEDVIYIGDGAGWIRSIHDEHFKRATFIIDWYHASEHIWDCGKALFGEGTQAAKRWVERRQSLLWDGWTRKLLNDLRTQFEKYSGDKREALETLHRYISVNEEQMRYDVFRSKGYDIGSGAVEGACKHLVGKRLKASGMIWTRAGSSAVLALRTSWLNREWSKLWTIKPLAA
jgi:hypothetical protein